MARLTVVGIVFVSFAVLFVVLATLGVIQIPSGVVLAGLSVTLSIPCFIMGSIGSGMDRDAAQVRELESRGIRRAGRVIDAIPYASVHGGAALHATGAQMALSVELEQPGGTAEHVTLHVVEPSESARARIGTRVVVLEHPDEPSLRCLEGFLPNGRRA